MVVVVSVEIAEGRTVNLQRGIGNAVGDYKSSTCIEACNGKS